jgi:polyhydroxybutyrate depolymerase
MWLCIGALVLLASACTDDDGNDAGSDAPSGVEGDGAAAIADVEPVPSAGCGSSSMQPGQEKVTLQSGGTERWYLRHVPAAHDGTTPVPVVVDFHGYSEGADIHAAYTLLGAFGDEKGFVTLTPHGAGVVPMWQNAVGSPDMTFVGDMLDEVGADLCIDTARIYATGLSNGAMMTSAVSCDLADRFAAAAPVAGVVAISDCQPGRAVPVVAFHGTDDPFLDFEGGFGPGVANLPTPDGSGTIGDSANDPDASIPGLADISLTVPEVLAQWADRNGCRDADPDEESVADDVTLVRFDCPEGAEVELYRVERGGHTWPGTAGLVGAEPIVGRTTQSIDADEIMWEFFVAHPMMPA